MGTDIRRWTGQARHDDWLAVRGKVGKPRMIDPAQGGGLGVDGGLGDLDSRFLVPVFQEGG